MKAKKFKKDAVIVKEESTGEDMYVVLSGKVSAFKTINAEQIELGTLGPGDFFGEMSLFLSERRSATVKAVENCEIRILDKAEFIESMKQDPEYFLRIFTAVLKRLKHSHEVISRLKGEKDSLQLMYGSSTVR